MWIRSQDKTDLIDVSIISVGVSGTVFGICFNEQFILGQYKPVERALEVLETIQNRITELDRIRTYPTGHFGDLPTVFQMPAE